MYSVGCQPCALPRLDGKLVKLVVGRPRRAKRRLRPRRYDQEVLAALKPIWYVFDFMCGKRLVVVLRTMLPMLESFGEIELTAQVRGKLNTISAATIDRLLQHERARLRLKGRTHIRVLRRALRKRLRLSRQKFADRFGLDVRALSDAIPHSVTSG